MGAGRRERPVQNTSSPRGDTAQQMEIKFSLKFGTVRIAEQSPQAMM